MRTLRGLFAVVALAFLAGLSCYSAEKKAMIVFIGDYPDGSGWTRIHSLNDKPLIMGMLSELGFSQSDIICLEDSRATFRGICSGFEKLIASCRTGDRVYIHFSCHGQQITDVDGDESLRSRMKKYDEAIVPYDAYSSFGKEGYSGDRHLIDDLINEYLCRIEDKIGRGGQILLVMDACHSGDGHRDAKEVEEGFSVRGVSEPFELPLTGRSCKVLPREAQCMVICACQEFERNFECEIGGKKYGRLSYAISSCLKKGMTPAALQASLDEKWAELKDADPIPRGRSQTLFFSIPGSYNRRRLF